MTTEIVCNENWTQKPGGCYMYDAADWLFKIDLMFCSSYLCYLLQTVKEEFLKQKEICETKNERITHLEYEMLNLQKE